MNAIDQLLDEHQAVRAMIVVWKKIVGRLGKGENINISVIENLLGYMKWFVDRCHHTKEESYLFPALMMVDDPQIKDMVKTFTREHARCHNLVHDLSRALEGYKKGDARAKQRFIEGLKDYIVVLGGHEVKETDVLLKMAKEILPEETQEKLREDFERVELEHIGAGRHEQFHKMLDRIQQSYNL